MEECGLKSGNRPQGDAFSGPMQPVLQRQLGVFHATMMGLGSILGTGVFVTIGIAAGITGPSVILAILVAGLTATFNGLSSAQLAANHPVSGGTYEYAYRWLHPTLAFTAGWLFLCAKSASAATAALGCASYIISLFDAEPSRLAVALAVGIVIATTVLVSTGIRRSSAANIAIVSITLFALSCFVVAGLPTLWRNGSERLMPFFLPNAVRSAPSAFLEACALMFVAFTGYGRIATLSEEVIRPRTTIPRAVIATLVVSSLFYIAVALVEVSSVEPQQLAQTALSQSAPLERVATRFAVPVVPQIVAVGAVTAMLGVLVNLILGLSRVILAMARRGDLPKVLGNVRGVHSTPLVAIIASGLLIGLLTCVGNVKTTWSFSAFTVLVYYAVTNLAATRLKEDERLYPTIIPLLGLSACVSLAFWVEPRIWATGLGVVCGGWILRTTLHSAARMGHN